MIKTVRITKEWDHEVVKISEGNHTDYYRPPYSDEIQALLDTLDQYPNLNGLWYLTDDSATFEAVKLTKDILNRPQPEVWKKGDCYIYGGRAGEIIRVTCRNGAFKSITVKGLFFPKGISRLTSYTEIVDAEDLRLNFGNYKPLTLEEAIKLFEFQALVYGLEWELY